MQADRHSRHVASGSAIFRQGDPGDCAYLIERGSVDIVLEGPEGSRPLARRGPGDIVGEMAIIDGRPRSATAVAVESCELLPITKERLTQRLAQADPVVRMCLGVVLDRFRATLSSSAAASPAAAPVVMNLDAAAHAHGLRAIRLEQELAGAIDREEFELHLQPIMALGRGDLAGFEALIRWRHPVRGMVSPGEFIPLAEATGLIVPITRWAFGQACRISKACEAVRRVGQKSGDPLFVTVNISGRDFADPEFLDRTAATLRASGADPRLLKLEITESTVMGDPEQAAGILNNCRKLGLKVALDDFGTGHSSLAYFHLLPFDSLKIDRSFVRAMGSHQRGGAIMRSILNLADNLEVPVVAEGVEQATEAATLKALGCAYGQGFYYARPLPEAAAMQLLAVPRPGAPALMMAGAAAPPALEQLAGALAALLSSPPLAAGAVGPQ